MDRVAKRKGRKTTAAGGTKSATNAGRTRDRQGAAPTGRDAQHPTPAGSATDAGHNTARAGQTSGVGAPFTVPMSSSMVRILGAWVVATAIVMAGLGLSMSYWPTGWEPAQQATLAGSLLAGLTSLAGFLWKTTFDELTAIAAHRRELRGRMLEQFLANRTNYYTQLIAIAGDLASVLIAVVKSPEDNTHPRSAFYYSARYVEVVAVLRSRFQRLAPSDHPAGLVLRSGKAEERVWNLILEPWTLGYWSPEHQSALIDCLRRDQRLLSPQEFLSARQGDAALNDAWESFRAVLDDRDKTQAIAQVLDVLNALLDYETGRIIDAWYGKPAPYPRKRVLAARGFFEESTTKPSDLAVRLPPLRA